MKSSPLQSTFARFCLCSVHLCARIKSSLEVFWQWVVWHLLGGLFKHKGTKVDLIIKDSKLLKKVPFHLAFVLTEKEYHYDRLVQLICWAFISGIQYVSIFDQKGELQKNISELRQLVEDHYQCVCNSCSTPIHVVSPGDITDISTPNMSTDLWLLVLSSDDGRNAIVGIAQALCQESQFSVPTVDPSIIDNRMTSLLPDPDLAIVCGHTKSLQGYPPWTSRSTEIMWLSSHYKCSYYNFHFLLQQYAKSVQRYGK